MRKGLLAVVAIAAVGCSGVATQKAVSGEPDKSRGRIRDPCTGPTYDGGWNPGWAIPPLL